MLNRVPISVGSVPEVPERVVSAPKPRVDNVPTRFARTLLGLVVERGYSLAPVLDAAGLDFDPMRTESPGYRAEISALEYSRIYQQVLSLLQDRVFGLSFGATISPGAFRMMCYCIISCENLGKAIKRSCEFYRIFFHGDARLRLEDGQELAVVGYSGIQLDELRGEVTAAEVYSLQIWLRFYCWLTGRVIEPVEVRFRDAAPDAERQRKYEHLFGCPVRYGHGRDELVFPSHYLASPLVHTEQSLKEFLRSAPYPLMVMPGESESGGLVSRVRALIGHDFSQGLPSFETITRALNMSAPTLRRRLRREGMTFQQLKDECRRDAAIAYLGNPELSINAVAALMGFTDPSAFHRSFKKWTGMTPGEYRSRELSHMQPRSVAGR